MSKLIIESNYGFSKYELGGIMYGKEKFKRTDY